MDDTTEVCRPGYYAVIPADVRYDDQIPANAKLLYGEISALIGAEGFCYASNQYFSKLYGMADETIARLITKLEKAGHITRVLERDSTGQIVQRKLFLRVSVPEIHPLDEKINTPRQKNQEGIDEKVKETNLSITDIDKENKKRKKTIDPLPAFVDWIRTTFPGRSSEDLNALYAWLAKYTEMRADTKSPLNTQRKVNGLLSDLYDGSNGDLPAMCEMLKTATRRCWLGVYPPGGKEKAPQPNEGMKRTWI